MFRLHRGVAAPVAVLANLRNPDRPDIVVHEDGRAWTRPH